jgi:pimeloyl-ACP methyl ester carboxylesterase
MRIPTNGIELWLEEAGAGPPVFLIMGIGAQHVFWPDRLVALLVGSGLRVLRFDNRDIGASTWLDHLPVPSMPAALGRRALGLPVPAPYTLRDMAADVIGLMDTLGLPRAHLVGASMGGMIAQEAALGWPERVASLTSIMSSPGDLWSMVGRPEALRGLLVKAPRSEAEARERGASMFRVLHGGPFDPEELDLAAEISGQAFTRGSHPRGFLRHFAAIQASGSRRGRLGALKMPVTVIHGRNDPLLPLRAGLATAAAIPGAELVVLDEMGHTLPQVALPALAAGICKTVGRA